MAVRINESRHDRCAIAIKHFAIGRRHIRRRGIQPLDTPVDQAHTDSVGIRRIQRHDPCVRYEKSITHRRGTIPPVPDSLEKADMKKLAEAFARFSQIESRQMPPLYSRPAAPLGPAKP